MQCDESELTASTHLDKRLTPNEERGYMVHLETCADCRTHLAELEQVSQILKNTPKPEVTPQLRRSVMNAISGK